MIIFFKIKTSYEKMSSHQTRKALEQALDSGNIPQIQSLLRSDANGRAILRQMEPFGFPVGNGDEPLVRYLLSEGVIPDELTVESVSAPYPNQTIARLIQEAAQQGPSSQNIQVRMFSQDPQKMIIEAIATRNQPEVNRLASIGSFNAPNIKDTLQQALRALLSRPITDMEDTIRWIRWLITNGA
jgi:hypothetical protein